VRAAHPQASSSLSPSSTPSRSAKTRPEPAYFLDLGWIDPQRGWALVATTCPHGHGRCTILYGTSNGGRTWSRSGFTTSSRYCEQKGICDNRLRFVTSLIGYLWDGLWFMTTDGGSTWTPLRGHGAPAVEAVASAGGYIFRLVYRYTSCPGPCDTWLQSSRPGGRAWTTLYHWSFAGPGPHAPGFGAQLVAGGANLYVTFFGHLAGGERSAHAEIWVSHRLGRAWSVLSDPCGYVARHEEDAVNAAAAGGSLGIVCISRDGRGPTFVALSRDAGGTFTASRPLHVGGAEQIAVDGDSIAVGGQRGVRGKRRVDYQLALSGDGGRTWRIALHDYEPPSFPDYGYDLPLQLQFVGRNGLSWVNAAAYFVWRSFDGGQTWRNTPAP
jgi:photosystem II stability/assembly factor-like uncharacterized protein